MTFGDGLPDVSRETSARLAVLAALLRKWNPAINLVAPSTLEELEERHMADSLQLVALAPPAPAHWADFGSGGGFPGLVVAAALAERAPAARVTLVDSDRRKASFLRTAAREMGLDVTVRAERAEAIAPLGADVVSARALAPLRTLLGLAERHMAPGGCALFPKGARAQEEIEAARKQWRFVLESHMSRTDPQARVLAVREITRA